MKTVITALVTLLLLLVTCNVATAGPSRVISRVPAITIHEYIGRVCNKNCVDPDILVSTTKEIAEQYDLDQSLLLALVKMESGFNQKATNKRNGRSVGLAQIQVRWHKEKFSGRNVYDVRANIDVAAQVLKACKVKHHGNTRKALLCYNGYSNKAYPGKVFAAQYRIRKLAWENVSPVPDEARMLIALR